MRTYKEFSFNIAEDGLSEGHLGGRIKEDRVADAIKARGEKPNIKTRGQQAKKDIENVPHSGGITYRDTHKDHMANAKGHPAEPGQSGAGENDPRRSKRKPAHPDDPHRGTGKNYDKHDTITNLADTGKAARDDHKNWGPDHQGKGQNSVQHGTADAMKKSEKSDLAKKLKQPFKPKKESVNLKTYEEFKLNFGGGLSEGKMGRVRVDEAKAKPYTFLGTLQGGRSSDKDGKESRGQQVVIDFIDEGYWHEELSKVKNPDDFFDDIEEYCDIDMRPNNSRDAKKVMQAIAKKKLWVDRDSFGDSIIGTGPDKKKLRSALIDYRD